MIIRLCLSKNCEMFECINLSSILDNIGRIEMELYIPVLLISRTLACFHSLMKLSDCRERFKIKARGWAIMCAIALNILPVSLFKPTALFSGMDWSCFSTNSVVTVGNLNIGISGRGWQECKEVLDVTCLLTVDQCSWNIDSIDLRYIFC